MPNHCEWSDLPADHCDHCGAAPGVRLPPLGESVPARQPEPRPPLERTLERPSLPPGWAPHSTEDECRCGRPARDGAWLCDVCQESFGLTLADLGALDEELVTTIARQRAIPTQGGSRSAETPIPWHEKAAEARRVLHGLLVLWVRFCDEEGVRGPVAPYPADRIASLAAWLSTRVHGLALLDIGPEALDEITDAAAECHRLVFWKRKSRVYLGTCGEVPERDPEAPWHLPEPCPGEVYAEEGADIGACEECDHGVTVVIRKAELDKMLDDRLCTAAEIARLSTYLGLDVPRDRVRNQVNTWHKRGRIKPASRDATGDPLFRYGSVKVALYATYATRETAS